MQTKRLILIFLALCSCSAAVWGALWPFWLDSPGYRSNSHDPKSPLYRSPTPVPPTPVPPTWTFTASPPSTATDSPTISATATPTQSPSATPTVTPTATISPLVYFDGDTAGARLDNVNKVTFVVTPAGASPGSFDQSVVQSSAAPGPHSGLAYGEITVATLNYPFMSGIGNTPTACVDTSPYQVLSMWMQSPDGCMEPMVMLTSPGAIPSSSSAMVTASAYTTDGGTFDAGVWKHVVIPLAAFNGNNEWGNSYSLAANANLVNSVSITPAYPRSYYYFAGGPFWVYRAVAGNNYNSDSILLDDVQFQALNAPPLKTFPPVFDAFISPDGVSAWNTQWSNSCDSLACVTPTSSFSFPAAGSAPVDFAGTPLSECYAGHISGTFGGAVGTAPCNPTDFSYINMSAPFQASGAAISLTTVPGVPLTAGQIHGISVYLQEGPTSDFVSYDIVIRKASIAALNDGAQYYHSVPGALPSDILSDYNWHQVSVAFPAVGSLGTDPVNSFGQPAWAAGAGDGVPWDTTDTLSIVIEPDPAFAGMDIDILVGQIKFY